MSHYLKVTLDAIFGARNFVNEIVWRRAHTVKGNAGQGAKHFGRATDSILFYSKTAAHTFHQLYEPYSAEYLKRFHRVEPGTGRRYRLVSMLGPGGAAKGIPFYEVMGVSRYWRYSPERMRELIDSDEVVQSKPGSVPERKQYLDEGKGIPLQSLWADIPEINPMAAERLGYPTQKPVALLERIIRSGSNPGDPPRGVMEAVNHGGTYTWPVNGQSYPRIQVITVADLLSGKRPEMPPPILPYIQAARAAQSVEQMTLDGGAVAL